MSIEGKESFVRNKEHLQEIIESTPSMVHVGADILMLYGMYVSLLAKTDKQAAFDAIDIAHQALDIFEKDLSP